MLTARAPCASTEMLVLCREEVLTPRKTLALCAGALVVLAGGCSRTSGPASPSTSAPPIRPATPTARSSAHGMAWSVVALGDSVPAGTACKCTPFPQLSASDLSIPGVRQVTADNLAMPGYTTEEVLDQVGQDTRGVDDVMDADVIEIEIGANDVGYSAECGSSVDCYAPSIPHMEQNLRTIVDRAHTLTAGHPALVVLLDYWAVWLGGQYAQAKGPAYVEASATITDEVDTAIKAVAAETGSAYIDLRAVFKGPSYSADETRYLTSDGDHPNGAGHLKIAAALDEVIETRLRLSPA